MSTAFHPKLNIFPNLKPVLPRYSPCLLSYLFSQCFLCCASLSFNISLVSTPAKPCPPLFCLANPVASLFSPTGIVLSSNYMLCFFFFFAFLILTKMPYKAWNLDVCSLESNLHIISTSMHHHQRHSTGTLFSFLSFPSEAMQVISGSRLHWSLWDVLGKQQILCVRVIRQTSDRSHLSIRWLCDWSWDGIDQGSESHRTEI